MEGSKTGGNKNTRNASLHVAGQCEVRVIEDVEHLGIEAQRNAFPNLEVLGDVDIRVNEMRPTYGVSSRIPELTVGYGVSTGAAARWRVHHRHESIWVDPLARSSDSDAADGRFAIHRHTSNATGKLRPAGLKDTISVRGVWLAQDCEWQTCMEEGRLGKCPAAQDLSQQSMA